jgi:hypothetical protein
MAKILFTAKAFRRMTCTNLRDHETQRMTYPVGYTEEVPGALR